MNNASNLQLKLVLALLILIVQVEVLLIDKKCKTIEPAAKFYKETDMGSVLLHTGETLDPSVPTYFVLHGWRSTVENSSISEVAKEISRVDDTNAIMVNFEEMADQDYIICSDHIINTVGQEISKFIVEASKNKYFQPSDVTIIAYSLGAHVAGFTARLVQEELGRKIKRISALDPAGPGHGTPPIPFIRNKYTLKRSDANMLDVLHTSFVKGASQKLGHVDFFAGGRIGVGFIGINTFHKSCGLMDVNCQHHISIKIYLESIRSCGFIGSKYQLLRKTEHAVYGYHMKDNLTGVYSFTTNKKPPFAQGPPECPSK